MTNIPEGTQMITKFNNFSELFMIRVTVAKIIIIITIITENGEDLRRNESEGRTFPGGETVDEAWNGSDERVGPVWWKKMKRMQRR